jgi:hypothetical protein
MSGSSPPRHPQRAIRLTATWLSKNIGVGLIVVGVITPAVPSAVISGIVAAVAAWARLAEQQFFQVGSRLIRSRSDCWRWTLSALALGCSSIMARFADTVRRDQHVEPAVQFALSFGFVPGPTRLGVSSVVAMITPSAGAERGR